MTSWKDALPEFARDAFDAADESEERAIAEALGSLVRALPPAAPSPGGHVRLLAAARAGATRYAPFFGRLGALFDVDEARVAELLAGVGDASQWHPGPLPRVESFHLAGGPRVAGADVGLVRHPAGMAFPRHRHLGVERVFVLEGGYRDDLGKVYGPGDLHEMAAGTSHAYAVLPDEPCVVAVVLFNGIEVEGVGRVG
jgi:quercetin dioxygenase-like cupin family protein